MNVDCSVEVDHVRINAKEIWVSGEHCECWKNVAACVGRTMGKEL